MPPKKHPSQTTEEHALDAAARRRHQRRLAQARYRRTAKGRATYARYNATAKRKATNARYVATPRGQQVARAVNDRRIFVGRHYHGRVQTTDHAAVIRSHIKERVSAFITRQQAGAETQGVTTRAVSAQTITRAD